MKKYFEEKMENNLKDGEEKIEVKMRTFEQKNEKNLEDIKVNQLNKMKKYFEEEINQCFKSIQFKYGRKVKYSKSRKIW